MAMMAPTNTTESRDVLLRSGVTIGTESENLNLSNVFFEHGDNVMCSPLLENSKPATEKTSVGSWKGTNGQDSIILHTGSPLRRSVRLNNTISAGGISAADEDTLQKSMKRRAWKNLDGAMEQKKAAPRSPTTTSSKSYNPHSLASIPDDRCASSLNILGFTMGSSRTETTLTIKALKNRHR
jgi:hypothetical protein